MAFVIAPDLEVPRGSSGQFLGLTNETADGEASNHFLAVEFDTFKQRFDPDSNHIGVDINGVRSYYTASLSDHGVELASKKFFHVWVCYDGVSKRLEVYVVDEDTSTLIKPMPTEPVVDVPLDIRHVVKRESYFRFTASTGDNVEVNSVVAWNLTVEDLGKGRNNKALALGLGIGLPVVAILAIGLCVLWKRTSAADDLTILGALKSLPGAPRQFSFGELKKSTENFHEKNKLGEGGFGVVYKGILPPKDESLEIAVKRFNRDKMKSKDDFLAELTIINRLRHRHLVRLLGWCLENGSLLLVYEYMPNGSLDTHIFCPPEQTALAWNVRCKILSGVASALHYLHYEYHQMVLHRDLKASNIMLDINYNARVGDFGLARAIDNEKSSYSELHGVHGTFGYIALECVLTGKVYRESDIYGFGAVILEVVCGKRPWREIDNFPILVDWVWYLHREGRLLEAVDGRLGSNYETEEAERLLLLGLACSHPTASERPNTQAVVQILSGLVPPPAVPPIKPPFGWPSMGNIDGNTNDTTPIMSSQSGSGWSRWIQRIRRETARVSRGTETGPSHEQAS